MDPRTGLPVVGMVGGGQLARMTHQAAIALGQSLAVLAESGDDSAAQVCSRVQLGAPDDPVALRTFAAGCDVVTFDHEHVPEGLLRSLVAEGVTVHPGPDALRYAQDKSLMRTGLADLGLPVPAFRVVTGSDVADAVATFAAEHDWPVVVKTARGGYDGRGVWIIADGDPPPALPDEAAILLEACVPLHRELAAVVARSPFGQAAAWPVVQTVQRDGICVEVIAPAPDLAPARAEAAQSLALRIADRLGVVGVLAVELFELPVGPAAPDGLMINELAMRPHNSAHWSIDGSLTSQFEQHLRAVLDYPLGRTDPLAPVTVMANVLGGPDHARAGRGADARVPGGARMGMDERVHHLAARFPEVQVHLYGKAFRPGRKLGHVTVLGDDLAALRRRARLAADWLGTGTWADGYDSHGGDVHGGTQRQAVLRADGLTGRRRPAPSEGERR